MVFSYDAPFCVVLFYYDFYSYLNPKFEYRNPKQYQNSIDQNSKLFSQSVLNICISVIIICFVFRISIFVFSPYGVYQIGPSTLLRAGEFKVCTPIRNSFPCEAPNRFGSGNTAYDRGAVGSGRSTAETLGTKTRDARR